MINILSYEIFERKETLVDKKIQVLKDLSLELEDIGLQVEIVNGNHTHLLRDPRITIHTNTRYSNEYKNYIIIKITDDNNILDNNLTNNHIIDDFIDSLKSYGLGWRSKSGGDNFCIIKIDKWGKRSGYFNQPKPL